jgi:hypothetical protein
MSEELTNMAQYEYEVVAFDAAHSRLAVTRRSQLVALTGCV